MPWLLDTHVWVWSQLAPDKLGPATVGILEDVSEPLFVATISTLEVARLVAGGQIQLQVSVEEWVNSANAELSARTIDLTHAIAAAAYRLPGQFHRDPADRILVATALQHGLAIITADQRILDYDPLQSQDATR